jgi:hypothetical protein
MKISDDQILRMSGHKTLSEMEQYDVRGVETLARELKRDLDTGWKNSLLHAV